jgi:DNA-binding IclR family transcriptional regulator
MTCNVAEDGYDDVSQEGQQLRMCWCLDTVLADTLGRRMSADLPHSEAGAVLTLRRGLAILDAFSASREQRGVNEIARLVQLHKSTVSRLCATLEQTGYLERDTSNGKFRLGARLYQLVGAGASGLDLRGAARPVLQSLAETTGETANLAALQGTDLVIVEVVEGHHLMRMQGRFGQPQLFHASALGLAILASLPRARVDALLGRKPLLSLTACTIVDRRVLRRHLKDVRARGYSVDFEGVEVGLRCVGAAVRDQTGSIVGAISVSGPRHRLGAEVLERLGSLVRDAAAQVSARLGAPPVVLSGS